ncbi:nucleotidyltransferase family protein [Clostridium tyrobutyricum]|uniref:nucleotidyltransferase family protein n=1 Tax=Clostridium tyrobutyricum TaxID=1519 RepID=UPI00189DACA5|nr:nucleotidyltransferase family protein [Clostridium tyrobutyricum]
MMVEGIVLAAGLSSRAKTFKMALPFRGKTIIENCVENMMQYCNKVYVIGGHKIQIIQRILKDYDKVKIIYNSNYKQGMYSSVKTGITKLEGDKFFLTPGDYPLIDKSTYNTLLNRSEDIVIPTFKKKKGHPVFMEMTIGKQLLYDNSYDNLRDFINSKGFIPVEVEDRGIILDVDTMEQYRRLTTQN